MHELQADPLPTDDTQRSLQLSDAKGRHEFDRTECVTLPNGFVLQTTHRRSARNREDLFPGEDKHREVSAPALSL